MCGGCGEHTPITNIEHHKIPINDIAIHNDLVPSGGMTGVSQRKTKMLCPKERHPHKWLQSSHHGPSRGTAMLLRKTPMLDSDPFSRRGIRIPCDVARRVDAIRPVSYTHLRA